MDFLLIVHKKYEKNLFLEYIINNYSTSVLFYHTSDIESMSLEKIVKHIDSMKPTYVIVDEYELLYQPIQLISLNQLYLIKLDNRKLKFSKDKVNLMLFNRYEALILRKLYSKYLNKIYCFEDFQVNYQKIDETFLFVFQRTNAMNEFLNCYSIEVQKLINLKLQSFFTNAEKSSFDYALKILIGSCHEVKDSLPALYESLKSYANSLKDLSVIEKQNYKTTVFAFKCDFLPYKYTFNSAQKNQYSELLYTNKIIVFPKYESSQVEEFINDICEALFLGSYVFIHEANQMFIEYFAFKNIGIYNTFSQLPQLLGNVKLSSEEVLNDKRLILQFENIQSTIVEKNLQVLAVKKEEYVSYMKSYIFKDSYKLLNIYSDTKKKFSLSSFISPTLGNPEGMEITSITVHQNDELRDKLSKELPEKICFFDRNNLCLKENSYLSELDIYYYSCDLEDFDVTKLQTENEIYITSSIYLLEYFQSKNLQSMLETSYKDYKIKSIPSKEIATYLYMHDNEKDYKRICENELIDEGSKQALSAYIAEKSLAKYHVIHPMIDNQEIKSIFNHDTIKYSKFVNKIIENHLNTQLSLLSSSLNYFDIYANNVFLYSVMDSVKAFCNYKRDLETIQDFLNTMGEYKFFIYPPSLDSHNLSLLLTTITSLKETYVILPQSYKSVFEKLGINSELFSFYDTNSDVIEIYQALKDNGLRVKAIEKYLEEIIFKKF